MRILHCLLIVVIQNSFLEWFEVIIIKLKLSVDAKFEVLRFQQQHVISPTRESFAFVLGVAY